LNLQIRKYVFKNEKTYSLEYAKGLRVLYLQTAGALYEVCRRRGIFHYGSSDPDRTAEIRSKGKRAGRPAQYAGAVAAITGWGKLAGVIGLGDFVHQIAQGRYDSTEEIEGNSPRAMA